MNMAIKDILEKSRRDYDKLHREQGFGDEKESYEVVATLIGGKRALDIGCGSGFLEQFYPDDIVGVDFSKEALKLARENGAKYLCQAPAERLPFKDNAFEVSVSFGVLEHVALQFEAIQEMARVSRVQILIVHARLPLGLEIIRPFILKLFGLKDQPIEKPLSLRELRKMARASGLKVIFEGLWNYIDLRWLWKRIPYGIIKWPSHHLLIAIKSKNLNRRFTGENGR